jgi:hypothetical protein
MKNETEITVDAVRLCLTTETDDAARYPDPVQMQAYLRNVTGADIVLDWRAASGGERTGEGLLRIGHTLYVHDYYLIGEGEER